jgi:hypothetical protein
VRAVLEIGLAAGLSSTTLDALFPTASRPSALADGSFVRTFNAAAFEANLAGQMGSAVDAVAASAQREALSASVDAIYPRAPGSSASLPPPAIAVYLSVSISRAGALTIAAVDASIDTLARLLDARSLSVGWYILWSTAVLTRTMADGSTQVVVFGSAGTLSSDNGDDGDDDGQAARSAGVDETSSIIIDTLQRPLVIVAIVLGVLLVLLLLRALSARQGQGRGGCVLGCACLGCACGGGGPPGVGPYGGVAADGRGPVQFQRQGVVPGSAKLGGSACEARQQHKSPLPPMSITRAMDAPAGRRKVSNGRARARVPLHAPHDRPAHPSNACPSQSPRDPIVP